MAEEHFRKLERMYGRAPCNRDLSAAVTIGEGRAEVRMPVQEALFHAAGAVHGAYYFKLLDDAAFFAANSIVEGVFVLTVSFNVQLLRPVSSGTLISRGTLVRSSKSLLFADAIITAEDDREISRGTGIFSRSRIPLNEDIGYE